MRNTDLLKIAIFLSALACSGFAFSNPDKDARALMRDISEIKKGDVGILQLNARCLGLVGFCGESFLSLTSQHPDVRCLLEQGKTFRIVALSGDDVVARVDVPEVGCENVLMTKQEFVRYKKAFRAKVEEFDQKIERLAKDKERIRAANEALKASGR